MTTAVVWKRNNYACKMKHDILTITVNLDNFVPQGADIDFVDCKGHSPLLLATSCGAWRTVSLLLSHGNLNK